MFTRLLAKKISLLLNTIRSTYQYKNLQSALGSTCMNVLAGKYNSHADFAIEYT